MSPRKERNKIPAHIVQGIRDKRKKLLHGPYSCPRCGLDRLRIGIDAKMKEVIAVCFCGLELKLDYVSAFEAIDYYNKCVDKFYKNGISHET